jgi:hypothetical protein
VESGEVINAAKQFMRRPALWLGLIVILLIPFPTTIVPEWKLRVVDEAGMPFAGARVRQSWHHYSYGVGDIDERDADADGYVAFPERKIWYPILYRILRTGLAALLSLAHGSIGIRADVWAYPPYPQEDGSRFVEYKPGEPQAQKIVLRR